MPFPGAGGPRKGASSRRHHRTAAVVDLCFFSRCGDDDACCSRAAQLTHEALHRLIVPGQTVSETKSCQIALLLRPRARPCSISSRYASQALRMAGLREKGTIKSG